MQRYKITVEYDGRPYYGWQRQDGQPSVQQALEEAAAMVDGAPVLMQGGLTVLTLPAIIGPTII
ncbi:MAG: hypothetical protein AAFQ12_06525, partial [Pseudomonadota bacterium]